MRSANVSAHDGLVIDRFEVTDRDGAKLGPEEVDRVRELVRTGAIAAAAALRAAPLGAGARASAARRAGAG